MPNENPIGWFFDSYRCKESAMPASTSTDTGPTFPVNIAQSERLGSVLGGALLTLLGIRSRSNLGAVAALVGGGLIYRGVSGHCGVYAAIGKNTAEGAKPAPPPEEYFKNGIHVEQAFIIKKPAEELFKFWRNFENLPRFMTHLQSVTVNGDKRSHWVVKAPAGFKVEWDAEIINEEPNKLIAWRSLDGADVHNAGSVRFLEEQDPGSTEVRVVLDYLPPAGQVGHYIAKLFGESPDQQIRDDLRHFKQYMETGEIPTAQP